MTEPKRYTSEEIERILQEAEWHKHSRSTNAIEILPAIIRQLLDENERLSQAVFELNAFDAPAELVSERMKNNDLRIENAELRARLDKIEKPPVGNVVDVSEISEEQFREETAKLKRIWPPEET